VEVERNGQRTTVTLPPDVHERILASGEKQLFAPRVPLMLDTVLADGPAARSGLLKTDQVLAVGDRSTPYFGDFRKALLAHKDEVVTLKVERDGARIAVEVPVSEEGTIGVGNAPATRFFTPAHETFGLLASIPAGIGHGWETLSGYVSSLKLLFTKSGASQIGGFGTIGSLFSPSWDWRSFWNMTAFLSIILAFMNILPIPALDGGHVMFLIYEMIVGKPAPQRVLEVAQMIGMVLLFGLLLFANGNDLFKGITGRF
jgi:regulator of sigma E protease